MMNNKVIVNVCDWLQRLVILYSCGEDELPQQTKLLMKRAKTDEIKNWFLYTIIELNSSIESVESIYSTTIGEGIKASFVVVNCEKDINNIIYTCNYYEYGNELFIIIDKRVVDAEDNFITVNGLDEILRGLINEKMKSGRIPIPRFYDIIVFAVIKAIINLGNKKVVDLLNHIDNSSYFELFFNVGGYCKKIPYKMLEDYIDNHINFSSVNMIDMVNNLLNKLENGDLDMVTLIDQIKEIE